jgi:hypothetical protein
MYGKLGMLAYGRQLGMLAYGRQLGMLAYGRRLTAVKDPLRDERNSFACSWILTLKMHVKCWVECRHC